MTYVKQADLEVYARQMMVLSVEQAECLKGVSAEDKAQVAFDYAITDAGNTFAPESQQDCEAIVRVLAAECGHDLAEHVAFIRENMEEPDEWQDDDELVGYIVSDHGEQVALDWWVEIR